jgi:hypothetical protein
MNPSEFFFKVGGTAWLLLVGGGVFVLVLGWLDAVDPRQFDWRFLGLVFGAGGLAAMIIGGVCAIWESQS